jgi:hypothetical protein
MKYMLCVCMYTGERMDEVYVVCMCVCRREDG